MSARDRHGPDAPWGEFGVVGKPLRKIDGLAKATGASLDPLDIAEVTQLRAERLAAGARRARDERARERQR